jgi:hypothetical protein
MADVEVALEFGVAWLGGGQPLADGRGWVVVLSVVSGRVITQLGG